MEMKSQVSHSSKNNIQWSSS